MTLPEIRESLSEAIRYVRSDRVEAERLTRGAADGLGGLAGKQTWLADQRRLERLERTAYAAAEALVVDPDAAAGGLKLVRHEIGLMTGGAEG